MKSIQQLEKEKGSIEREIILRKMLEKSQSKMRRRALQLLKSIDVEKNNRSFKSQLKDRIEKSERDIMSIPEKKVYHKKSKVERTDKKAVVASK